MQYTYQNNNFIILAVAYSCGAYGADTYSSTSSCSTVSSPRGGLAETGYNIIIPVALALALLLAGTILVARRIIRRKRNR